MSYTEIVDGKRVWSIDNINSVRNLYKLALENNGYTEGFNGLLKYALLECGFEQTKNRYVYALGKPVSQDFDFARVQVITYISLRSFSFIKVASRHGVEEVKDISELFNIIRKHWK